MSLKNNLIKGLFWSSIQLYGNQLITFSVSIILARLILPEEFGLIAMLSVFIGIGNALINSGLTSSLTRAENVDEEDYSTVFFFNLAGSIFVYLLFYILGPFIAKFYEQDQLINIIRIYGVTFIINAFSTVQLTRLNKNLDFKTQVKVNIPSLIISGILGILLAIYNYGVWSLVYMSICQSIVNTIQLWYWSRWKPILCFKKDKFKTHFKFGINLLFSSILDIIFNGSYTIIIGKFFSPIQVGYYNRADSLQMLPVGNISSIINKVTYPLFSSIHNDNLKLKDIYKRIMKAILYILVPILVIMSALAEPLFRFLFTEKWLNSVPYFRILCAAGILYPIHSYNLQILKIKGRSDLFFRLEVIKKIMMSFILIISFQFGIYGLLYGSILNSILALFINTYFSGKFINYPLIEQINDILPTIIVGILIGTIVFFIDTYLLHFSDIVRLIIGSINGISIFLIITYILKFTSLKEIIIILKKQ
jgi:teichuronic acid exporter